MKKWKQCAFFSFLAILVLAFAFVACDNGSGNNNDPKCSCPNGTVHTDAPCECGGKNCGCTYQPVIETPQFRTQTINFDLGEERGGLTAVKIEGELLADEWEGMAEKIQNALQVNYDLQNNIYKNRYRNVFSSSRGDIARIVIVKNSEFDKWHISNRYLIYFNFEYLINLLDEEFASNDVIRAAVNDGTYLKFRKQSRESIFSNDMRNTHVHPCTWVFLS
jgi:hypothetical protein